MPEELDALLGELRAEGQVDSSGRFTLDIARALEKMRRFQLDEPRRYVLNLVAGAVAGGARRIGVHSLPDEFAIEWDGLSLHRDDMLRLFEPFHPHPRRDLTELARGLAASRALPLAALRVESCPEKQPGFRLLLDEESVVIEPLPERPRDLGAGMVNRIVMSQRANLLDTAKDLWNRLRKAPRVTRESELIREHCALAAVPLELNGQPVNRPFEFPGVHRSLWLKGPRETMLRVQGLLACGEALPSPGNFSAYVALADFPLHVPTLTVVRHGLRYDMELQIPYPGGLVLLSTPELAVDASQTQIVTNHRFHAMLDQALAPLDELVMLHVSEQGPKYEHRVQPLVERLQRRLGPADQSGRSQALGPWTELARAFWEVPFLHYADQTRATLKELVPGYVRRGYLPVTREFLRPTQGLKVPADGARIVHVPERPAGDLVDLFFPEQIPVHASLEGVHLTGEPGLTPRLPPGEYLVRRFLTHTYGELGLPLSPEDGDGQPRLFMDDARVDLEEHHLRVLPRALVATTRFELGEHNPGVLVQAVQGRLPEVYEALIWGLKSYDPGEYRAALWHLLECLELCIRVWRHAVQGGSLCPGPRELMADRLHQWGPVIRPVHAEVLDSAPFLPTTEGGRMTLQECLERPERAPIERHRTLARVYLQGEAASR